MRFVFWPGPNNPWADTLAHAKHAESTGWDGVYYADHFMPNGPDATPLDGQWEGAIDIAGTQLDIIVKFDSSIGALTATKEMMAAA